ncbi:hypothetical protein M378DRAFT_7850 [Amanita muscaria Koide BX008]|uniref:GPI transamidase component PIG-T n=1 Tax=Amanita muscaria (strain Koide BX008) TaxID=946122 RepID=A0A0C2XJC3_AMAMK|nr:hypothetical protein M378DRAFT_7850 [Amanita muscaria Koide BX008]
MAMKGGWKRQLLVLCYLYSLTVGSSEHEQFNEQLTIRPLRDGRVSTTFAFTALLKGASPRDPQTLDSDDESQHYTLFPLSLGQILREYAVTELHLTLNAGRWNYDGWGYPDESGVGAGAELWAWMGTDSESSADVRWKGLRNALAGLFCASLGSLDDQRTTSPTLSFQPHGFLPAFTTHNHTFHALRHASLPSENVCTENLTPFLKLLPCKSYSGLSSLLNPHRVFDADWHGMSVHVLWIPDRGVQVRLAFQAVFDPLRLSQSNLRNWSLQSLFAETISQRCPVAHTSEMRVGLPVDAIYSIQPEPHQVEDGVAKYDLRKAQFPLDVAMYWPHDFQHPSIDDLRRTSPVPISVDRTLKGTSQASGHLSLFITNRLADTDLKIVYLETMPWHLQLYLHTMRAEVLSMQSGGKRDDDHEVVSLLNYIPSIPHSRPTTLQALLRVPANSTLSVKMDVTKSFLRYTEYPPDAQRGWDLPPAVFTVLDYEDNQRANHLQRQDLVESRKGWKLYTRPLLVDLATPDFSMPYNVIIFTCSIIAFLFGTIFNMLTRKFVLVKLGNEGEEGEDRKEKKD